METLIRVMLLLLLSATCLLLAVVINNLGGANVHIPVGILCVCSFMLIVIAFIKSISFIKRIK